MMVDNLLYQMGQIQRDGGWVLSLRIPLKKNAGKYLFMTLHRPSNVDDRENFSTSRRQ